MKIITNLLFALNDGLRCVWYGTTGKFACTNVLGDIGSSPVVKTLIIYNVRGGGSKLLYEILYEMVKFR